MNAPAARVSMKEHATMGSMSTHVTASQEVQEQRVNLVCIIFSMSNCFNTLETLTKSKQNTKDTYFFYMYIPKF